MSVKVWLNHSVLYTNCVFLFLSVLRDISERGRELEQVLNQYITFVKPAFEEFCLPVSIFINVFQTKPHFSIIIAAFNCALLSEKVSRTLIWLLPSASSLLLHSFCPKWSWTFIFADQKVCRRHHPPRSRQSRWVSRSLVILTWCYLTRCTFISLSL